MKRGPARTPAAILSLKGSTLSKRRRDGVQAEPAIPPKPDWLLPAATAEWDRIAPELAKMGTLARVDLGMLAAYCQAFAHWRAAEEWMSANGTVMTMRDDKGNVKWSAPVPQFSVAHKSLEKMLRFASELGLSPASRTRLEMNPPSEKTVSASVSTRRTSTPRHGEGRA